DHDLHAKRGRSVEARQGERQMLRRIRNGRTYLEILRLGQHVGYAKTEELAEGLTGGAAFGRILGDFERVAGITIGVCDVELAIGIERETGFAGEGRVHRRDHVADGGAGDRNVDVLAALAERPAQEESDGTPGEAVRVGRAQARGGDEIAGRLKEIVQ